MAAIIAKNETVASKRRALMEITAPDGATRMRRSASFVGRLFIGQSTTDLVPFTGSMTNVRRPYTTPGSSFTFTADSTTDKLTKTAHGLETGDGPIQVSNAGGGLPGGLAAATNYWVIKFDDNTFRLATSLANAYLDTFIDITSNGTGTQTLSADYNTNSTRRGMDGEFVYEFTQAETNVTGSELVVWADDTSKVFTADNTNETVTLTAHELTTGVIITVTNVGGGLPAPLVAGTPYYVIRTGANTFKLATSLANALAGTAIDITSNGTGTNYIDPVINRTYTTVDLANGVTDIWNYVLEGSYTAGDLVRLLVAVCFGLSGNYTAPPYSFKSLDGAKTRGTNNADATGRLTAVVGDLTP